MSFLHRSLLLTLFMIMAAAAFAQGKVFRIPPDTEVYTTTLVMDDRRPIVYVFHEEDGAWQFHSDDDIEDWEAVAITVTLAEIVERDPSVVDVADMPPGHYAMRNGQHGKWKVLKDE